MLDDFGMERFGRHFNALLHEFGVPSSKSFNVIELKWKVEGIKDLREYSGNFTIRFFWKTQLQ